MKSQNEQIKAYLLKGNAITPLEALNMFGCFRLGARIADLKSQGLEIITTIVNENGKRFASYKLA